MSLVSRRANFTFVAGAALVTTGITFAFGAPAAGARPAAAPPGHGKAPAAVNGDNGTVKIHNSSTPVTDRRNEPHVCVFYLDAFGFDPGQSVSWQIKSWPPTGDRAVVDQGTLTARQRRRWPDQRPGAAERALQALLDVCRRAWRRQAEGVLGVLPLLDPHADPDPDVALADPDADMHLSHPTPAPTSSSPAPGPTPSSPGPAPSPTSSIAPAPAPTPVSGTLPVTG